jgi:hypothetical protein
MLIFLLSLIGGFPPGDDPVREWFTGHEVRLATQCGMFQRSLAFLIGLSVISLKRLKQLAHDGGGCDRIDCSTKTDLAARFRNLMIEGQTFEKAGTEKLAFFTEVVGYARTV